MIRWQDLQAQIDQGELYVTSTDLTSDFIKMPATRDCLAPLARDRTLWILNWVWPKLIPDRPIPEGYDTYIFVFYREPPDWQWLYQFAADHPRQEIIVAHEIPSSKTPYLNLNFVEHHHLHYKFRLALQMFGQGYVLPKQRTHRISSLCNKPNFYKTLLTAYLHLHHRQRSDIIMSWNINARREICGSMADLDIEFHRPKLDELRKYYFDTLKDLQIKIDTWQDDHYQNWNWTNTMAYRSSLVNFTNETYTNDIYPGPWFGEKTRKPLLAGNALLPIGASNVYHQLERFGFRCDFPWDCSFDKITGNLDRMEYLFGVIEEILLFDFNDLCQQCWPAIEHNFHWSRDTSLDERINQINQQAVQEYLAQR